MIILRSQGKGKTLTGGIQPIRIGLQRKPLKKIALISILLCISSALLVFAVQKKLPPEVPLFYGLAEGEEQLSDSLWLTLPSLASLGIIFVNRLISIFWKKEYLRETLALTSLAVAILSTITTLKIILLIGNF